MKKTSKFLISIGISASIIFGSFSFAQTVDNQLVDANQESIIKNLSFKQFNSCNDIDKVLSGYIPDWKERGGQYFGGNIGLIEERNEGDIKKVVNESPTAQGISSSSTAYSTTNVQKFGVDEPEIIKTDGKYIYYYNTEENKIYIMSSPLNQTNATININNAKITTIVNVPEGFYNIQLFVTTNRLIILGTKYYSEYNYGESLLDRRQKTVLAIYDTTKISKLKILKFSNIDGSYTDARMIGSKLYIVSQMGINRYYYNKSSDLMPQIVDTVNGKQKKIAATCNQISYILPDKDTWEEYGIPPQFTLTSILDVQDTTKDTKLNVLMAEAGQIHVNRTSLYILQNLYSYYPWTCDFCAMPRYQAGEQTLIHKFTLDGYNLKYQKSNIVPGTLLSQYSMDEDSHGNFRLLTQQWDNDGGTNFYVFNPSLKLQGRLEKIAPGEEFKGSRYIGTKLYLVTFEQIDPLFVIDITSTKNPKIIGELKVPGYSTYLHPLGSAINGVQYLIGLGYSTSTGSRGGIVNAGIKLSLYVVNYKKQDPSKSGYVLVSEIDSLTLGEEGSWSEALANPRLFVMDSKNNVTIPLLQTKTQSGEDCEVYYDNDEVYDEGDMVVSEECVPIDEQKVNFVGLKSFNISKTGGIKEVFSKNFSELFAKAEGTTELDAWDLTDTNMRVGFAGDSLYFVNTYFANFLLPTVTQQSKYLYFSDGLK